MLRKVMNKGYFYSIPFRALLTDDFEENLKAKKGVAYAFFYTGGNYLIVLATQDKKVLEEAGYTESLEGVPPLLDTVDDFASVVFFSLTTGLPVPIPSPERLFVVVEGKDKYYLVFFEKIETLSPSFSLSDEEEAENLAVLFPLLTTPFPVYSSPVVVPLCDREEGREKALELAVQELKKRELIS